MIGRQVRRAKKGEAGEERIRQSITITKDQKKWVLSVAVAEGVSDSQVIRDLIDAAQGDKNG